MASIFFGSAERPLSLQEWPKKETFGSLNCILSGLRVKLFFLHTSKKFRRFPSCSWSVFPKMIMSSAIPVTPGMLRKIVSSFHWNTSCAMMEPIGSLVHWNLPMSNTIVVSFLDAGCSSTIQITFVEVSYHELSHSMEFSKYFLDASGVIWLPFQSLIQVPWIQANSELFLCWMVLSVGISWNLLFHYYKTVHPFSHLFNWLQNS